jgi:hypothetical protein
MLLAIVALAVSGCLPDEMPTAVPTPTFTVAPQPDDNGEGNSGQSDAAPTQEETIPEPTPFDLTQLHATDPTTVNLASGKPTLLEFFAFW